MERRENMSRKRRMEDVEMEEVRAAEEAKAREGEDPIFGLMPVEIQENVLKYLDVKNRMQMRLVCRNWNEGVLKHTKFNYKKCSLNDSSAKHVLKFPETIKRIEASDLSNKRRILTGIAPFGVVNRAKSLLLGARIHPAVMKKLLKTANSASTLGLCPMDPTVGEELLRFVGAFENITIFKLLLVFLPGRLEEEELFLRKLSLWRKFSNLKTFGVKWDLPHVKVVTEEKEVVLVHRIYISLHRILYSHRETVENILWDFANLTVFGVQNDIYNVNLMEYLNLKQLLATVKLQEVTVRMNDMEGEFAWDLTETVLRYQNELKKVTFLGTGGVQHFAMFAHVVVTFAAFPIAIVNDVVERNQATLVELHLEHRVFSFYSIENCRSLRKLTLRGASIVSTSPLNHMDIPTEIEELYLDFKFVFAPDIANLMGWIVRLNNLRVLALKLKMEWTSTDSSFPTLDDFPLLLGGSSLTKLIFHFDISSGFKFIMVKKKVEYWWKELKLIPGIHCALSHSQNLYMMELTLDRKVFTGIPMSWAAAAYAAAAYEANPLGAAAEIAELELAEALADAAEAEQQALAEAGGPWEEEEQPNEPAVQVKEEPLEVEEMELEEATLKVEKMELEEPAAM